MTPKNDSPLKRMARRIQKGQGIPYTEALAWAKRISNIRPCEKCADIHPVYAACTEKEK